VGIVAANAGAFVEPFPQARWGGVPIADMAMNVVADGLDAGRGRAAKRLPGNVGKTVTLAEAAIPPEGNRLGTLCVLGRRPRQ
jgi:hypothetical protein